MTLEQLKHLDPDIESVEGTFGIASVYEYINEYWKPRNIEGLAIAIRKRSDPGPVLCIFSKDMKQKFWEIGVGEKEIQLSEARIVILIREADSLSLVSLLFDSELQAMKCRETIVHLKNTKRVLHQQQQSHNAPGHANTGGPLPPPPVATSGSKPPGSVVVLSPVKEQQKVTDIPPPPIATSGSRPAGSVVMTPIGSGNTVKSRSGSEQRRQSSAPPPIPTPTSATINPTGGVNSGFPSSPNGVGVDSIFNVSNSTAGVQQHQQPASLNTLNHNKEISSPPPKAQPQQNHSTSQQASQNEIFSHRALSRGVTVEPPIFEPSTGGWRCGPDINELRLAVVKVAMSEGTSVSTLKAMLQAYQNH